MGILLIGIVGALFFRNEPLLMDDVPTVRREKELNAQLREREVAVYLEDTAHTAGAESAAGNQEPNWTLRELLQNMNDQNAGVPLPVGVAARPAPADLPVDDFRSVHSGEFRLPPADADPAATEFSATSSLSAAGRRNTPPASELPPLLAPLEQPGGGASPQGTAAAQSTVPGMGEFEEYTVRYGDTLSHIAERFLGSQARFQEIYEANRDRLSAPDRLQVGKAIRIPRY